MLLLLRNYTLSPAFRLKSSVLPVATRHFLTTSPNRSPALTQKTESKQKTGDKKKTGDKQTGVKPKRILKKDITPPFKKPLASFVKFSREIAEELQAKSKEPITFMDTLRESSAAWRKLSDAEKKSYRSAPEDFQKYRDSLEKWYKGLSPEALKVLKKRRQRKVGTGFALFLSETYNEAKGEGLGGKISDRSKMWNLLPAEKKEEYKERATETLFGVRAKRVAQRDRLLARQEKKEAEMKAKKIRQSKKKGEEKKKELKKKEEALRLKLKLKAKQKEKTERAKAAKMALDKAKKDFKEVTKTKSVKKQTTKARTTKAKA